MPCGTGRRGTRPIGKIAARSTPDRLGPRGDGLFEAELQTVPWLPLLPARFAAQLLMPLQDRLEPIDASQQVERIGLQGWVVCRSGNNFLHLRREIVQGHRCALAR